VLGKGGGALIAVIVLMAITSSGSAEMVAVSSLLTYDIYKVFLNKKATGGTNLQSGVGPAVQPAYSIASFPGLPCSAKAVDVLLCCKQLMFVHSWEGCVSCIEE